VVISGVVQSGPADRAGIKPGDLVLEINEQAVKSERGFLNLVAALKPDDKARVKLIRRGAQQVLEVSVGKRPPPRPRS
jgi:serine protease DegQ